MISLHVHNSDSILDGLGTQLQNAEVAASLGQTALAESDQACNKCKEIKPLDEFPLNNKKRNGRDNWCSRCHHEYYRSKNPKKTRKTAEERFWERILKTDSCWEWTGGKTGAYGSFWCEGKTILSHIYSWKIHNGDIAKGVAQECGNSLCCNPKHLYLRNSSSRELNRKEANLSKDNIFEIILDKGTILFDRDCEFLLKFSWYIGKRGYAATTVNYQACSMHHMIIGKPEQGYEVDHKNRNRLDNRRSNLHFVTIKHNRENNSGQINASSKYRGVSWNKRRRKWEAFGSLDSKKINLGYYNNEKIAAETAKEFRLLNMKNSGD